MNKIELRLRDKRPMSRALAAICCLLLASCLESTSTNPPAGAAIMNALVNRTSWESTTPPGVSATYSRASGRLEIDGENYDENGDISNIIMIVTKPSMGSNLLDSAFYYPAPADPKSVFSFNSTLASKPAITLTAFDTSSGLIAGTFSFIGVNNLGVFDTISNGSFMNVSMAKQ